MKAHCLNPILVAFVFAIALALPAIALADSQVMTQARVEPAYPVLGQDVRLIVLAKDRQGRPIGKAQVVATGWMNPIENPGMSEMLDVGSGRANPIRVSAMPQKNQGEYVVTSALPMEGRWRIQVWINSPGATGKTDLEVNVVSGPAPQGTNWAIIVIFLGLVAFTLGIILRLKRVARFQPTGRSTPDVDVASASLPQKVATCEPPNLLARPLIARFLKSRWYPAIIQVPVFAVFSTILYLLFLGPPGAHDNLGSALVWIVWWPALPILFLCLGRFWCAVCPMSGLSDLIQRLFGRRQALPPFLKRWGAWLVICAFLLITWLDPIYHIVDSPSNTAYLLLLVIMGVMLCGIFFERRAWCRYLCFIGGMSSNYSMSSMLELRSDGGICNSCRSNECVRGSDRAAGCPMFEFPRMMESNRHCNLCGNCIKSCSRNALQLRLRFPGQELWLLRRRHREEAFFAVALVGIVAVQTVVMLDVWDGFQMLLGQIGIDSYPVAFTLTLLGGVMLWTAVLAAVSAVSARLSGGRFPSEIVRYAYALIPLGLAAHLAHNVNHLLGEILAIPKDVLALVGLPFNVHPALVSVPTIQILQYLIIILGTVVAIMIVVLLASQRVRDRGVSQNRDGAQSPSLHPAIGAMPHIALIVCTAATFFWIFSQGMMPRMQISAMAHDDVLPAQIEKAKVSVREFVGRDLDLSYVHLEEHGYRDIILRSGDDFYFVDSDNYMVVSTFSNRITTSSNYRIGKDDAERVALNFALKHYPNFYKNSLKPEEGTEESSPFIGGHVFKWRQYIDSVPTPNAVKVITDDVGRVAIYSARDVPVSVPTAPKVSSQQALQIAQQMVDYVPSKETVALDVGAELTGRQMLRWTVRLDEESSVKTTSRLSRTAEIVVDALSGEVTSFVE